MQIAVVNLVGSFQGEIGTVIRLTARYAYAVALHTGILQINGERLYISLLHIGTHKERIVRHSHIE